VAEVVQMIALAIPWASESNPLATPRVPSPVLKITQGVPQGVENLRR
jgi:hypothetical protein